jgi:hypothetical protein
MPMANAIFVQTMASPMSLPLLLEHQMVAFEVLLLDLETPHRLMGFMEMV